MKILNVRFRNINSLKGDWSIEFDKPPLADAGIFAIVGPTGAGKTTILDAISLGLYGKTARLVNPAEHIITKHTGDSYSEVTFAVKDKVYCSKWAVQRARKKAVGKVQTPKMELADLSHNEPQIIEHQYKLLPEKVAKLTGLDFHRFMRSIVLAQGDFAAFLNANDNDRAELLEKMTGTEIYAHLSKAAFEKAKEENQILRELEIKLKNIHFMSDEEIQKVSSLISETEKQIAQINDQIKLLNEQEKWLTTITTLDSDKQKIESTLTSAYEKRDKMKDDITRLEVFEKALHYKGDFDLLESKKKEAHTISLACDKYSKEIPQLQKNLDNLESQKKKAELRLRSFKVEKQEKESTIEKIILKDNDIKKQKNLIKNTEDDLKKLKTELDTLNYKKEKNDGEIQKKKNDIEHLNIWLDNNKNDENLPKDIPLLKEKLTRLIDIRKKLNDRRQSLIDLNARIDKDNKLILQGKKQVDKKSQQVSALKESITDKEYKIDKLLHDNTLENLESDYEKLNEKFSIYKDLLKISQSYSKLLKDSEENNQSLQIHKVKLEENKKAYDNLVKIKSNEENIFQSLENAVKNEMLISKYEDARKYLKDNEPCPLCGSCEHPFVGDKGAVQSNSQQALKEQKAKVNNVNESLNQESNKMTENETLIKECQKKQKEFDNQKQQLCNEWSASCSKEDMKVSIDIPDEIAKTRESLDNTIKEKREKIKIVKDIKKEVEKEQKKYSKEKDTLSSEQTKLNELKLNHNTSANEAQRIFKEIKDSELLENENSTSLESFLSPYNEKLPDSNKEHILLETLQARSKTFTNTLINVQKVKDSLQELDKKESSLAADIKNFDDQVRDRQKVLEEEVTALSQLEEERETLFGKKDPEKEKKKLGDELERCEKLVNDSAQKFNNEQKNLHAKNELYKESISKLEEIQEQIKTSETAFITAISQISFSSIEEFKSALLSPEEQKEIAKKRKDINELITQTQTRLHDTQEKLQKEREKNLTDSTFDSVKETLEVKTQALDEQKKSLHENQLILKQQSKLKEDFSTIHKERQKQKAECQKWDLLKSIIGSADGKEFRKFAQGLTLERLLLIANSHLLKLNDRYYLDKKENEDLAFEVVDTYQADIRRPTTTLSGGESFLVSLALALGLSELASKSTRIDSFFLDEGFGTLDTETLDSALTTLENLQSTGKIIGVISHVEALKERITTQIRVEKLSGGVSRIAIEG